MSRHWTLYFSLAFAAMLAISAAVTFIFGIHLLVVITFTAAVFSIVALLIFSVSPLSKNRAVRNLLLVNFIPVLLYAGSAYSDKILRAEPIYSYGLVGIALVIHFLLAKPNLRKFRKDVNSAV